MPNASWRRAGVARRNGEGYLPPVGRENRVIFVENYGETPCAARGAEPLAFCLLLVLAFQEIREGVAGRNGPLEVGAGGREAAAAGRRLPPSCNSVWN
jgi:hypothetical protein